MIKRVLITGILLLTVFMKLSAQDVGDNVFRLMTYNIKYDDKSDPVNNWTARKDKLIGLLKYHNPDLFGVQEALYHQMEDIKAGLTNYDYIGVGRDDGKKGGEYSAIFYNRGRLLLLESGTFWLSEHPDRPGKSWDAAFPRICTWGKFKYKKTGDTIYYFNTHFDHIGEVARLESAKLILKKIKTMAGDTKTVLSGDFNVTPDSVPYKVLAATLKDTYNLSDTGHYGPDATFNGFHFTEIPEKRIDHIFINHGFKVLKHATLTDSQDMLYPSDHFPVVVDLEIE